jgi:hypothetical protein
MHYIASQKTTDQYGVVRFLLSPIDGSRYGERVPSSSINWADTLSESDHEKGKTMSIDRHDERVYELRQSIIESDERKMEKRDERRQQIEEMLDGIRTVCFHCHTDKTPMWDKSLGPNEYAVMCSECSASTGFCETPEDAVDNWCGVNRIGGNGVHVEPLKELGDVRDKLEQMWEDHMIDKDFQHTMDGTDGIGFALLQIWMNKIPGIRFECGGQPVDQKYGENLEDKNEN